MSMLLEDLAEETSASNRRLADRLEEEAQNLLRLELELSPAVASECTADAQLQTVRQKVLDSAHQATDYVISRIATCEVIWHETLARLRENPSGDDAEGLLQTVLEGLHSGQRLIHAVRCLWTVPQKLGATPERLQDLDRAEQWFHTRAEEAERALEHRASGWQPSAPDRFALGLQHAREGRTIPPTEARARFRRQSG
jgi:hypothetical protein